MKLQVTPKFPARVVAGAGLLITQASGTYTFALDYNAVSTTVAALVQLQNTWGTGILSKTAPYNVAQADSGKTFELGGNSFYELSFGDPATFTGGVFGVVNKDANAAKYIRLDGATSSASFRLWPKQTVVVYNDNGTWKVLGRGRYKASAGPITLKTNYASGSDAAGQGDGLSTPVRTIACAAAIVLNEFDGEVVYTDTSTNGVASSALVTIQMAPGTNDAAGLHFATSSGFPGQYSSSAVVIDGQGSTISGPGVQVFYGTLRFTNVTLSSTTGNGLTVGAGAKVYLSSGVVLGTCAAAQLYVEEGGALDLRGAGTITVTGTASPGTIATYLIYNAGGTVDGGTATFSFSQNSTYSSFTVRGDGSSQSNLAAVTWTLNGHTIATNTFTAAFFGAATCTGSTSIPGTGSPVWQGDYLPSNGDGSTKGKITLLNATAIPGGGTTGAGLLMSSVANFGVFFGSGAPTLSAAKGSLYLRSDGSSTSTRMYVNTDGGTTWTAVTTAA